MRRARTTMAVVALGVLGLLGGAAWGPVVPASGAPNGAVTRIGWTACHEAFQCADLAVPLDYDHPSEGTVTLALVRLPAADPAKRKGSLFINPGGPGGSGVQAVLTNAQTYYPQAVRDAYDLVGFDPRGIVGSTPLSCFDSSQDRVAARHPLPFPMSRQEITDWENTDRLLAGACAVKAGPVMNHMSTANVARDLDLLRRSVGDTRLNFIGRSYGSYIGVTYANLFPNNVGAMVVDGVLDPIEWSTGRGAESRSTPFTTRIGTDTGAEEVLDYFLKECDQAGPRCALSGGAGHAAAGHARTRIEALLDRAKVSPLPWPTAPSITFTYPRLIELIVSTLNSVQDWGSFATFLAELETGHTSAAPPAVPVAATGLLSFASTNAPRLDESELGVRCSDTDNPSDPAAWEPAADRASRQAPHFGPLLAWDSSACSSLWPGKDADRYAGPWRATTTNPVLVLNNRYDAQTPIEGAVTVSQLLTNSRRVTYAGVGHETYLAHHSPCIDEVVNRYLTDNVVPAHDTLCPPTESPFANRSTT